MKLLLDTHIILWFLGNVEKLSEEALSAITDQKNEKYVSIVSAWELAIKINLGKLTFEGGVANFFKMIQENGFELMPVKEDHIIRLETLPLHHRDPFDRLLLTTAISEQMTFITSDKEFTQYGVSLIY
jgi:PIN domain nuclease of toxin-antitoxin system